MLAIPKFKNIKVEPMTKYEYLEKILLYEHQHTENKWIKGYWCDCNGYTFWLREQEFNLMFEIDDTLCK